MFVAANNASVGVVVFFPSFEFLNRFHQEYFSKFDASKSGVYKEERGNVAVLS